jgi:hypothetical protein
MKNLNLTFRELGLCDDATDVKKLAEELLQQAQTAAVTGYKTKGRATVEYALRDVTKPTSGCLSHRFPSAEAIRRAVADAEPHSAANGGEDRLSRPSWRVLMSKYPNQTSLMRVRANLQPVRPLESQP